MQDLSKYTKKGHIEIQTRYLSLLTAGSAGLVGLVFALGVIIGGRQQNTVACPAPDPLSALDRISGEPSPSEIPTPVQLTYHETLTAASNAAPLPASLRDQPGMAAPAAKGLTSPLDSPSPAVETRPLALEQPRRQEEPVPEKLPSDTPGIYSLQVGSFQDQMEATQMVKNLDLAGHEAFLVSVNMPERGGTWFRVRVGPFESKKEAWDYKKEFEEKERLPAFVVKRKRG